MRNRANTATLRFRGPTITSDADSLMNDEYDFLIFIDADDSNIIKAKRGKDQAIMFQHATDTGIVLNNLLSSLPASGAKITFLPGTYTGSTQHLNTTKKRVQYIGNGAVISGFTFKLVGDASAGTTVEKCLFRGLTFSGASAGLILDSAFAPTIEHCSFDSCSVGISFESSASWTELWTISNSHFNNCIKSLLFKTPTGTGTGSYVNSKMDTVTFNASTAQTANYTFIEIQSGTQVNEGKWLNNRFWFDKGAGIVGIGMDISGDASRLQMFKPYFENFASSAGTIGIRINTGATGAPFFVGRPIFAGGGTWTAKLSNAFNKFLYGPASSWRESDAIVPSATINTYGTTVSTVNDADWSGIPNLYVIIGGTVAAGETITVEITGVTHSAFTPVLTKTYTAVGTFAITNADYLTLLSNNYHTIFDRFDVRAKSSIATTAATVTFGGYEGGSPQGLINREGYTWLVIKDATDSNRLKIVDGKTGETKLTHATDLGILLNNLLTLLTDGDSVSFQSASYSMATQYLHTGKRRIIFEGNGSTISGSTIKLQGTLDSLLTGYCTFRNFKFSGASAGLIFDNTFAATVEHCTFDTCAVGISLESSLSWTELWKISDTHFNECVKSIVFKTPTGTGTGSYINGVLEHSTFNNSTSAISYTHIEIQATTDASECKFFNNRFWFNAGGGAVGTGISVAGAVSRLQLFKPYFENFGTAAGTIGITISAAASGSLYFVGRPVFAGAGTWTSKIANASNKYISGTVGSWRESASIVPSATINTYGTAVSVLSGQTGADWKGIPNLYVIIGGTVGASETLTVEITLNSYSAWTPVVTKTYTATGTFPLVLADYIALLSNNYYFVGDSFSVRAKSSIASTIATVTFGGFEGGTAASMDTISPNTTLGDIIYRSATTDTRLAGNTTATNKFLTQTGTGSVSAAPVWNTIADSDLSSNIPKINTANDYSAVQEISVDNANLLTLQRLNSGLVGTGIKFNLGLGAGVDYGTLYYFAEVGSPSQGRMEVWLASAGSIAKALAVQNDGALDIGRNSYLRLVQTGLTAQRTITFPDITGRAVVESEVAITNANSPYTALATTRTIRADATSGAITINLPTAVGIADRQYKIYRTDVIASTNIVTIDGSTTETIEGNLTYLLFPGEWVHLESNGANWVVLARSTPTDNGYYFNKNSTNNRRYVAGLTNSNNALITSTTGPTVNLLYAMPIIVSKTTKFDVIECEVTTLGSGSNLRMGIYYDNGNCYPGSLIYDTGNISAATTGIKTSTITSSLQTLQPGLYWLTYENSATVPQIRILPGAGTCLGIIGFGSTPGTTPPGFAYSVAHTVGALPNPYTASATIITTASAVGTPVPAVQLRAI